MSRPLFLRLSLSEKILFARHLAIMIKAGMSLLDGLQLIKKQVHSRSLIYILDEVIKRVENGQFLSVSLEPFRHLFGDLFINVVKIGETSGTLADNLNYLQEQLEKSYKLRQTVRGAMVYPIVVLTATFGIGGFLTLYVFPKITPIFKSLKVELPPTTKFLLTTINFLTNYWYWIIIAIILLIIIVWFLLKVPSIKYFSHRFLLELPLIGKISKSVNIASFSRTLAILLKSGAKIVDAVVITNSTISNLAYQKEFNLMAEGIKRGESMSHSFLKKEEFFPSTFSEMIEVGENTGRLEENLFYLADFYESEIDNVLKNLSNILEPIILLIIGAIVGFIAISIVSPIYEITQGIKIR